MTTITIDCTRCQAPARSCDDCVVRMMLDGPATLNAEEQAALKALSASRLVPPLRLVTSKDDPERRAVA